MSSPSATAAEGDAKAESSSLPFTKRMRKATQSIHNISDALVNMKLGLTLSDETVWSEGILTFAPVFKHLEQALERNKDSLLGDLDVDGLRRSKQFDDVLKFYYGEDGWVSRLERMKATPAVSSYLQHLVEAERRNPYLLTAFVYHLYMGLLSGGQILSLKRSATAAAKEAKKLKGGGDDIFHFEPPHTVQSVKKSLRNATEEMSRNLDAETQDLVVQEGVKVFELNNALVNSVEGVDQAFWRLAKKVALVFVLVAIVFYLVINQLL